MSDVLRRICEAKREDTARRCAALPLAALERHLATAPSVRPFRKALRDCADRSDLALIAEIKKASPSKGVIRSDFVPRELALAYAKAGASCLSVLTDKPSFQGDDGYLGEAREAAGLPVLRKDFMLDAYQIVESRVLGADCVLLIMAALDDATAGELSRLAQELGMDVLVEVHDAHELDRALEVDAGMVGINNRNLKTLTVDLATTEHLAPRVPGDRLVVAESGLNTHADLVRLRAFGARAFLVGESLMRQPDVAAATRQLLGKEARA